ncbi:putative phage abortive infection protein [Flavobacterium sandaracinum]|uniref:Phage abortive infection protein n=1 Tax=Flavobacterium sandaracinum TaxID=2541733 RepID=A0A4R5CY86_9FLAO|nr:putative phage abortive infection protein [Flavobacterium sandaracinum]TDE05819.1 hypothetical protein E0F91_06400 [Flavobacterium sandaracinum]
MKTFDRKFWTIFIPFLVVIIMILYFPYWIRDKLFFYEFSDMGPIGDTIGGLTSPFIGIAGAVLTFLAFWVQFKANEQQKNDLKDQRKREYLSSFETKFFDLIRLHRENISDQNYTKFGKTKMELSQGRKVFRVIYKEFEECYAEVKKFHKIYGENFLTANHRNKLLSIINKNDLKIDLNEFALIDLSYTILYFGVAKDSEAYLSNKFKHKFKDDFYTKLITFLKLKPKKESEERYNCWKYFIKLNVEEIKLIFDVIYLNRRIKGYDYRLKHINFFENLSIEKYYGGHQHRLGHYYRHLFQSYKFLYNEHNLGGKEKYFYAKTLRAQLSNYEQSLLFLNSISSLGLKWDLNPEIDPETNKNITLISDFNLIKNVPGRQILNLNYKDYYPKVDFEFDDN